ncbi:hypothetical protein M0R45_026717 [Rubus argutus]|uniref:Chlorophyll a-b binding protein, chloroplastic n=1 Tax=Rubus argutus TaxID=59490 RepID=A0AAW1X121_RUBAR
MAANNCQSWRQCCSQEVHCCGCCGLPRSLGSPVLEAVATWSTPSGSMARFQHPSPSAPCLALSSCSWVGWKAKDGWTFTTPSPQSVEWATPWSRLPRTFPTSPERQGYPGGKFFDPLCVAGSIKDGVYIPDTEKLERLKLAEIKHARIAMLAMLTFYFEAGQGKTPLGALGL